MTDPTELRRLAEAATPGVWIVPRDGIIVNDDGYFVLYARCRDIPKEPPIPTRHEAEVAIRPEDAAYIAAMHPETTLALLDRLARAEALVADARRFRWVASLDHGGTREIRLSGVKRNGDAWSHGISWNRTSDHADIRAAIDAAMKEDSNA